MNVFRSVLVATLLALTTSARTTWYVDVNATPPGSGTQASPYANIQYALSRPTTVDLDEIVVAPGTYFENVDFLGKAVRLCSSGGLAVTVIDAQLSGSGVKFVSGETSMSVLEGFRVINGRGTAHAGATAGGGIYCSGASPTIRLCKISSNKALLGGGMAVFGGAPIFQFTTIRANDAVSSFALALDGKGGGLYVEGSTALINLTQCTITENTSGGTGGGVCTIDSGMELELCDISDNLVESTAHELSSGVGGGLASFGSGRLTATNCEFLRNVVLGGPVLPSGGGLWLGGAAQVDDCTIEDNEAGDGQLSGAGGGIASGSAADVSECTIRSNRAEYFGGGIYGVGNYDDCLIESNCSSTGGGAYATGALHIEDSVIRSNFGCSTATQDFGGGVWGPADVLRCTIESNFVSGEGGGSHGANLMECVLRNNTASRAGDSLPGLGGGAKGGSLMCCLVYGNEAIGDDGPGGALRLGGGAHGASLDECVVYGNRALPLPFGPPATTSGAGLANCTATGTVIFANESDRSAGAVDSTLEHCTVFDNTDQGVGGASSAHNCIIRGNGGFDVSGSTTATYCNIEGGWPGAGNKDLPELFWAPYGNPDGLGRDFHLRAGSPGIDMGDPSSPLDPDGSITDMGAFTFDPNWCPIATAYCVAKVNSLGCTPEIWSTGSPTLSGADDFVVRARQVINNKNGILFWGLTPNSNPFQGGTLCVASPMRTPQQLSLGNPPPDDCSGTYAFAFSHAYMSAHGFTAGSEIHAQYWSRDPQEPISQTGLTNAMWFVVCG